MLCGLLLYSGSSLRHITRDRFASAGDNVHMRVRVCACVCFNLNHLWLSLSLSLFLQNSLYFSCTKVCLLFSIMRKTTSPVYSFPLEAGKKKRYMKARATPWCTVKVSNI